MDKDIQQKYEEVILRQKTRIKKLEDELLKATTDTEKNNQIAIARLETLQND